MIFSLFSTRSAKAFGQELANRIAQHKTELSSIGKKKKYDRKNSAIFQALERDIQNYRSHHSLSIYSKAKLGTTFKFALLDHGFEQAFAEDLTAWLLIKLN